MFLSFMILQSQETTPAAEEGVVPPQRPQAVFVNVIGTGKDPFFPNSRRRVIVEKSNEADNLPVARDFSSELQLKSVTAIGSIKIAAINNATFEEGETRKVTTPKGQLEIKCVEIKSGRPEEQYVIVEIPSQRKTLKLWMAKDAR